MINEIILNIKERVVNSGNNLLLDKNIYKKYVFEQTQKKLNKQNRVTLISMFDEFSDGIILKNIEPMNIDLKNDMVVKDFINILKYSLLTGYIVSEVLKLTYTESQQFIIN